VFCVEQFGLEGLIARQGFFDDGERGVGGANFFDLHLFAFELLVILEEAAKDEKAMRREIASFDVIAEFGVACGNGDDFVIAGAGVDHGHDADSAGFDKCERLDRFLAENKNVERIVVLGVGLRDEAVVRRIKNGGVNNAIHADEAGFFVEFVFDIRTEWNFDDSQKVAGDFGAGRNVVPRVDQSVLP